MLPSFRTCVPCFLQVEHVNDHPRLLGDGKRSFAARSLVADAVRKREIIDANNV